MKYGFLFIATWKQVLVVHKCVRSPGLRVGRPFGSSSMDLSLAKLPQDFLAFERGLFLCGTSSIQPSTDRVRNRLMPDPLQVSFLMERIPATPNPEP